MDKASITLFNLEILQPSTFISDVCLGIAGLLFFHYIKNIGESRTHRYYGYFFLFMSLSGFLGAFGHSLYLYTGKPLLYLGWIMSCISVYFIEIAVFSNISDDTKRAFMSKFAAMRLLVVAIVAMISMNFLFITLNLAFGLILVVLPILAIQFISSGIKNNLYIIGGIILAIIPALLHSLKIKFSWIEINDFSHYFLIICLFSMFLGIRGLVEHELKAKTREI